MNLISLKNRFRTRLRIKFGEVLSFLNLRLSAKGNNIIIFHQGRCGSTLLEKKLLKSENHKIKCFSEIYSRSYIPMESNLNYIIDSLSRTTIFNHRFYEVKYGQENHLSFSNENGLKELVHKKYKFIILIRKDFLSQAKSIVYGEFSNKKSHYKVNTKISYEQIRIKSPFLICGRFYESLEDLAIYIESQTKFLIDFLNKLSAEFEIIYFEDIVSCDNKVECIIENLLGIKGLSFPKKVPIQKTQINYDEKLFIES